MAKRVAVIGAGVSGLTSIKGCLDEGLEPTCFERSTDIGGLWRFTEKVEEGRASIYKSVVTNTSKEMSCFSDFPVPDDFPNFLHNSKFLEYLRLYAKHFNLLKYVTFKTTVVSVEKRQDYPTTGQWTVITERDGKQESFIFDAVMICTGHQIEAYTPLESFPGFEKFKGNYLHSQKYKDPEVFQGKTVVIIGMGNSAADLAVEICRKAKKVSISTRGGSWVMSRVHDNGYPWDTIFHTRFNNIVQNSLPWFLLQWMTEQKMNQWFNHENYGLMPRNRSLMKEPVFNDDLPSRILCGAVTVKPLVKEFTENSAIFEDGTVEENVDVVIFATGYSIVFPFLEESVIKVEDNRVPLYKHVFPPHLEKPTMAVIGLIQPLGPIMPTSELQARWATRVFKGLSVLPPESTMVADTVRRNEKRIKWFGTSRSQSIQTDFIEYLDELAIGSGVKPDLFLLLLKDPKLALTVFFGPCSPFQFRLVGPGKWAGARNAILTQTERIIKPTKTRIVNKGSNHLLISLLKILAVLALFVAIYLSLSQH
ncbi:dimethylaniline monooxygenase [N-oxide-forming] 2-like isoform X1 [Hemicordylus capensis]|uniref:dimethylaniline monooxygenase [N-oxide-forming] 2-like isoform X1 n=2 Tax=Hemicordylus capensis TaxID=884348 RepID=UPI0023046D0D|nr:dimethylaniline monooxygenase [N-oxide-forming] 2-like isoform X1 [Hemicordylus capensis]XP_053105806.1 dimethylaniline monooxygenase [N-oxide-forming] 2-like isoform X1 [Hemicordylus capensis]XP_053105807.1 dimethylaniline monooxygenase [N-oxide-forming] 2-like isoform X1 [Hemicordylus capensis]XP_053105808.1 dimethylaniline monooxygenase [N-oxide-forming] 2-like isoform X1 [Hemicordylus capensis]